MQPAANAPAFLPSGDATRRAGLGAPVVNMGLEEIQKQAKAA